ncbi:MAG: DUF4258 domain-containing protein [Phyllobacteriaceae bacterium]|jgi:hypothetical protein|nr:DUF4258 domain-containing protein [Phyllobacteriaceae bacterium]
MGSKPLVYTTHATDAVRERLIRTDWIEACVFEPDWTTPDPNPDGRVRRFKLIDEYGSRILRVVCIEQPDHIRIITVFFDRTATAP